MVLLHHTKVILFWILVLLGMLSILLFAQVEHEGYMDADGFYLPLGDPQRGREAFIALKCFTCHQVETDSSLPLPVTDKPAPILARAGMIHNPGDFADAIMSPQHKIVLDSGGESSGGISRMGDFTDIMTVRQFINIVTYLLEEESW